MRSIGSECQAESNWGESLADISGDDISVGESLKGYLLEHDYLKWRV